jgi:ATP-dependent RNA helicase DeaD
VGEAGYHRAVNSDQAAPERVRFIDMPLAPEVQEGLRCLGYEFATPVQAATYDIAISGKDLMVQSKTGTGKTTAFGLPLVERIEMQRGVEPQALILCPTRELAGQVCEELTQLGDPKGVRVLSVYGGTPMAPQLKCLKDGCEVVVGTPGRVLDHVRRRTLRLDSVRTMVLDEADEMLSMGFWDEVTAILDQLPKERQMLLFSATLPDEIRRTAQAYMRDAETINVSRDEMTVEGIRNLFYQAKPKLPKPRNLLYILEMEAPDNAIIFCNTRDDASVVAAFLRRQGLHALALSGEHAQKDRERIMKRMKSGELKYLVATDVAARGIDISDLSHVVNYSLPDFIEVYVHRVGRTGRIGKSGTAVSLVGGRDEMSFTELKRRFGIEFEMRELPSEDEVLEKQAQRVARELLEASRDVEITSCLALARRLQHQEGLPEILALFLKKHFLELESDRSEAPAPEALAGTPRAEMKRPAREEQASTSRRAPAGSAEGSVRLFVSRGKDDGFTEEHIRALVREVAGARADERPIEVLLRRTHSFVDAPADLAEASVAAAAQGLELDQKPISIEVARPR